MLCFDDSLLDQNFLANVDGETAILVNSSQPADAFAPLGEFRIIAIDGKDIARRNGMGKVVNSALLGAFVAALEQPKIETMCDVIEQTAPAKQKENIAACREAYEQIRNTV